MDTHIWKNITWDSDYNIYWPSSNSTINSADFGKMQESFQEVFGLNISWNGNYIEAGIGENVPVIKVFGGGGSEIEISGLEPYSVIRMRKTGSNNIGMQERVANQDGVVVLKGESSGPGANIATYYFGEIGIRCTYGYYSKEGNTFSIAEQNKYKTYKEKVKLEAKMYDKLSSSWYYSSLSNYLIKDTFGWGGWVWKDPGSLADYNIGYPDNKEKFKYHESSAVSDAFEEKIPTVVFTNFNSLNIPACTYQLTDDRLTIHHNNKSWIFNLNPDDEVVLYKQSHTTITNPTPRTLSAASVAKDLEGDYNGGQITFNYNGYIEQSVSLNTPGGYVLPQTGSHLSLTEIALTTESSRTIDKISSRYDHKFSQQTASGRREDNRTVSKVYSEVRLDYNIGYRFAVNNIYRFDMLYFLGSDRGYLSNSIDVIHNNIVGIGGNGVYEISWAKNDYMYGVNDYWPYGNTKTPLKSDFPQCYHIILRDGFRGTTPNGWFKMNTSFPLQISHITTTFELTRTQWNLATYSGSFTTQVQTNARSTFLGFTTVVKGIVDSGNNDITSVDYTQPVTNPQISWIKDLPKHDTIANILADSYTKWYVIPEYVWMVAEGFSRGPHLYISPYGEYPVNAKEQPSYVMYNGYTNLSCNDSYSIVLYSEERKLPHIEKNTKLYKQISHQHNKLATSDQRDNDFIIDASNEVWMDLGSIVKFNDSTYSFMLVYTDSSGQETCYEWAQTVDPRTATYQEAMQAVSWRGAGMNDSCSSWGGLYRYDNDNVWHENISLRMARPDQPTHWFGAIGACNFWNNGVPGLPGLANWDSSGWTGSIDLYCRVE